MGDWAGRAANSAIRRRVTLGAIKASPFATTRIAERISSNAMSLTRKPLAPARSEPYTYSSSSNVVSIRTCTSLVSAVICRVASMPSMSGMRMSITTTSGRASSTSRTASAPVPASPAISRSGVSATSTRSPARISGWSSASTIRIGTASDGPVDAVIGPWPGRGWSPPHGSRRRDAVRP